MNESELRKVRKRLVSRFCDIRKRCNNPNRKDYNLYGAKGIRCEFSSDSYVSWVFKELKDLGVDCDDYESVMEALNNYSTDRLDSSDNYSELNCILKGKLENEYLQKVEVSHICFRDDLYIPLWCFDKVGGYNRQSAKGKIKNRNSFASEFSFRFKKLVMNYVWFDFTKPPLKVTNGKVICPKCGREFVPQRVLECKCGFHTEEAKLLKKMQERDEVNEALEAIKEIITKDFHPKLSKAQQEAEQKIRLACVKKHSEGRGNGETELTLSEIGFVLGLTKERVRQIEESAMKKIKSNKLLEVLQ